MVQGDVFFFSDMVGSTTMSQAPGRDAFHGAIASHDALVRQTIQDHGGHPMKGDGDCWKGLFAGAKPALAAAEALQRALLTLRWQDATGRAWDLHVRIGLHHLGGMVTLNPAVSRYEPELAYARRVMDQAGAEQILVSNRFYTEVEGRLKPKEWQEHPAVALKGLPGPHLLVERLWDGKSRGAPGARWLPAWLRRYSDQFVGRRSYLAEIRAWLDGNKKCFILHGRGGAGKTRLAAQTLASVADEFGGHIYAVPLEAMKLRLTDPKTVAPEMFRELAGAIGRAVFAENVSFQDPEREVLELLGDGTERLVLLDNWENIHHAETARWLVGLLDSARTLRCMVTTQHVFRSAGSESLAIEGMEIPATSAQPLEEQDGYHLFKARVEQHKPVRDLSDRESLQKILNLTDGLALGIELTAAQRAGGLTLREIRVGLEQNLLDAQAEEEDSPSADHPRHRTMDGCIGWAVNLLPDGEPGQFPALGLFPADFLPDAAQAVAGIDRRTLLRWCNAHLLEADEVRQPGEVRYRLLPVVREWARRRLTKESYAICAACFAAHYAEMARGWNRTKLEEVFAFANELPNFHAAAVYLGDPTFDNANQLVNLACALDEIKTGDRDANLRRAIACYEAALRVTTEQAFPQDWATTQNNLGIVYQSLPSGDRDANLRRAIACYEAALRVTTEQTFPQQWAATQNNLGNAYLYIPSGDRVANLRHAITCYEGTLRVYDEQTFPQDWATTHNNLGNAFSNLPDDDRDANLRHAIACYEAALRVRTEQVFPQDWATTQNNLGNAFSNLPSGDRDANLRCAIGFYQGALRVYTEQAFPQDWAMTQNNLGTTFSNLPSGDRDANLRHAVTCYEGALRVYTEQAFPQQWAMTQQNIAVLRLQQGDTTAAVAAVRLAVRGYRACGAVNNAEALEWWLAQQ